MANASIPLTQRIAFKQAKVAIILGVLLGILISLFQISVDYTDRMEKLQNTLKSLIGTTVTPAANALWNLDEQQANSVLKGLFSYPHIVQAGIKSDRGEFLVEQKRASPPRQFYWLSNLLFGQKNSHEIALTVSQSGSEKKIGEFYVVADPYEETIAFIKHAGIILMAGIVRNVVLAVMLLLAFYYTLTNPILDLVRFVSSLNPKEIIPQSLEPQRRLTGELGLLAKSINRLIDELNQGIRDNRKIQRDIEQLNQDLEKRVQEKTVRLHEAKQKADLASEAKSRFLATMSHELRTPLNAIIGYAQILKREQGATERQAKAFDTILESGHHLLLLINDVLDLAKIEAGKLELYPSAVGLPCLVNVIADIIAVKAEQKGVAFTCDLSPQLPPLVFLDEKRLRQVLLNLLGNAVKFTSQGRVWLRVNCLSSDAEEARLCFEVEDTGVGMAAGELVGIFQPFEQAGEKGSRAGGTGLGLAITRQLIQLMGADIRVESEPGKGSLFRFEMTVPVKEGIRTEEREQPFSGTRPAVAAGKKVDVSPPAHEMEQLYTLALNGDMSAIKQWATELGERNARSKPFAQHLYELAEGCQSRAIVALVEEHRNSGGHSNGGCGTEPEKAKAQPGAKP